MSLSANKNQKIYNSYIDLSMVHIAAVEWILSYLKVFFFFL